MDQRFSDQSTPSLVAVAFGSASICLLSILGALSSPSHDLVFHLDGSADAVYVPALTDLLLLSGLVFGLLLAVRERPVIRRALWTGAICFLPLVALRNVCVLNGTAFSHQAKVACFWVCCALTLVLAVFITTETFERLRRLFQAVLLVLALPAAIIFGQAAWFGVQARHLNQVRAPQAAARVVNAKSVRPRGRIIWIVLDELAHRQLFLHRPLGLPLPEFDRWRATSTLFTEVVPAGLYTKIAMPSLMTGRALKKVLSTADGQVWVVNQDGSRRLFSEQDTVFADAAARGYQGAIAGWYIPYCRMLPTAIQSCFWTSRATMNEMYSTQAIETNLVMPVGYFWNAVSDFFFRSPTGARDKNDDAARHIEDFVRLNDAADRILEQQEYNFVLLHMPIPHPIGIYDRRRKIFAAGRSNYVDNLALADAYLGHVRRVLEARKEWDDATVLVMGDHAWRTTLMWERTQPWTAEDEEASEGEDADNRPAYLVKLPEQHEGETIETEFRAVRTRALLDEVMQGEIQTPAQLQSWVEKEP